MPLYIASVREPMSRAISGYRYMLEATDQPEHKIVAGKTFRGSLARAGPAEQLAAKRDLQSLMLLGNRDLPSIDWEVLRRRVDEDYLLVLPQDRLSEAVRKLRNAFGVPWTPIAQGQCLERRQGDGERRDA